MLLLLKFSLEGPPAIAALQTEVAVWPSGEFLAFMRDSSSKHEPRTETFEKGTYPTDFWSSDDTHSGTDSETDGDINQRTLKKSQKSLLELHTERRTIALKAIEATEKKYYENYLLHAKKSKNQQFKCGDEVWFHHPEKYGMVVMPNIKGRVTERLAITIVFCITPLKEQNVQLHCMVQ